MNAMKPYVWLIELCAALIAIAGIWYGIHVHDQAQQQLGYDRAVAEYKAAKSIADRAALVKERNMQKQKDEALDAATERETKIRADYAAAHAAALGLQHNVADLRRQLATAPVEACRAISAAALVVFGECEAEYRAMAAAADEHASDVKTLSDAWPR
jgi:hypothetical protein